MGWKDGEDGRSKGMEIQREKARKAANRRAQARRDRDAQMPHGMMQTSIMTTRKMPKLKEMEMSKYKKYETIKPKKK
jgi:hypothetical protein